MGTARQEVLEYPLNDYVITGRMADGAINGGEVVTEGTNSEDVTTASASDYPEGVALPKTLYDGSSDDGSYSDGDRVKVAHSGFVYLEAAGSISNLAKVKTASSGKVQEITGDGTDDPSLVVGRAYESASSDGDTVLVKLE